MFNKLRKFFKPGKKYEEAVLKYYSFLIEDFNFTLEDKPILVIGRYYDISFKKIDKIIMIYYEIMEDYYHVHFTNFLIKGHPQIEPITKTSYLNYFIKTIYPFLSEYDFTQNNMYFDKFEATNEMEKKLLDQAKDLRLCLLNLDKIDNELN